MASTSLFPPFDPPRWLRNAHTNTIYSFLRPRGVRIPEPDSEWLSVEPGVELLLRCHWQPAIAPLLLLVHGLEGSSEAGYMQTTTAFALRAGLHVIRMNVRNCGESESRCDSLYNSGMSGDVARALDWALARANVTTAALGGFSMGGNLVLKYAGETASGVPPGLRAVVAVSPCLDLDACATALHRRSNFLYERRFLNNLKARARRFDRRHPGRLPIVALPSMHSVRAFDDVITGPFTGYRDAADYYARASASNWLERIGVPTLVIHAEDDPFIVIKPASRAKMAANPAIHFCCTQHGGHCAFMNTRQPGESVYWAEARVVQFCAGHFAESTTPDSAPRPVEESLR